LEKSEAVRKLAEYMSHSSGFEQFKSTFDVYAKRQKETLQDLKK